MITLHNKRKFLKINNPAFVIFSSLYIIGIICGALLMVKTDYEELALLYEEFTKISAEYKWRIVANQSLYVCMANLVIWGVCTLFSMWSVTSFVRFLPAMIIGCSSGVSSAVMIYEGGVSGIVYTMAYIVPLSMTRFFVWYVFVRNARKMSDGSKSIYHDNKHEIIYAKMIATLFLIITADVIWSVISVLFSNVIF